MKALVRPLPCIYQPVSQSRKVGIGDKFWIKLPDYSQADVVRVKITGVFVNEHETLITYRKGQKGWFFWHWSSWPSNQGTISRAEFESRILASVGECSLGH